MPAVVQARWKAALSLVLGILTLAVGALAIKSREAVLVPLIVLAGATTALAVWSRTEGRAPLGGLAIGGIALALLGSCLGLLMIFGTRVREPANRMRSASNLRQIAMAMHMYEHDHGRLPPAVVYGKVGRPIHSWRVLLLPYLEQEHLYKEFRLDESWDSPHNLTLLDKIPPLYLPPTGPVEGAPHATYYQVFAGQGTPFEDGKALTLKDITDDLANTILLAEAGEPVPWTKPVDLSFDARKRLPPLGGIFRGRAYFLDDHMKVAGFNVVFANCSTRFIKQGTDEALIRALITRNGREKVDLSQLDTALNRPRRDRRWASLQRLDHLGD